MKQLNEIPTRDLMLMLANSRVHNGKYCPYYPNTGELVTTEEIKRELATREHIPNKKESMKIRQDAAKAKKNR